MGLCATPSGRTGRGRAAGEGRGRHRRGRQQTSGWIALGLLHQSRGEGVFGVPSGSVVRNASSHKRRIMIYQPTILVASLSLGSAFTATTSTSVQQATSSTRTALHSTIDRPETAAASSLVPPSQLDSSSVSTLFENRVQKTYGRYPITFVSGDGCALTDETGKDYLDFVSGIATCA
ncbi:hypothetical protein THAOC_23219, partial [Thalassiosira oceanica]